MSSYISLSVLPNGTADTSVRIHKTGNPITAITAICVGMLTVQFSHPDHAAEWLDHVRSELAKAMGAPLPVLVAFADEVGADLGWCERPAGHDGNHRCTDGNGTTIWPSTAADPAGEQ